MNRQDIIDMARKAHLDVYGLGKDHEKFFTVIERFAALVASAEREACAKEAEDSDHVVGGRGYYDQLGDADATVRNIVAAIRARAHVYANDTSPERVDIKGENKHD